MTKLKLSTITAVALFSIIGCGSSGGNNDGNGANNAKTGTGYYVDSAVAGVDYVCGSQTGKTDADGKFTFEEGKECTFTLAGVPLRTTKADELADGKKIVEENPKVAKLLQSIDADGDLSNGIQVTDEVVEALTKALEETQSTGKLPEGETLTEVVANVGHDVTGVSGDVRTDEEVHAHLTQTQTEITKELLAGKTFYVYFIDHDNADTPTVREIKFNDDATSFTDEIGHVINAQIKGNVVTLTYPDGGTDVMTVTTNNDKYILLYEDEEDGFKLFYSEADAKATLDAESDDSADNTPKDLKFTTEYLNGKTFVTIKTDDNGSPSGCWTFNEDKTIKVVFKKNGTVKEVSLSNANWHIVEDGKLSFVTEGTDYQIWKLISKNSNSYTYTNKWYDGSGHLDDSTNRELKEVSSCPVSSLIDD